ncbi:MAG: oligosaccharide flippase family protein [Bacteroidota bacterium]
MNPIKKLAGQTAIYGISSILGRLLNYLLVPLHTRYFMADQYGTVTEMYAYVVFLIVILTYGMETAYFRYSNLEEDKNKVFSTANISLLFTSAIFIGAVWIFAQPIATVLEYPNHSEYIIWFSLIVALDAVTAIPFAKLRAENKAKRFAVVKLINIGINIVLNIFFIVLCPYLMKEGSPAVQEFVAKIYDPSLGIGYIFIANLIASVATFLLLIPEYFSVKYRFDGKLWRTMFSYGWPLIIIGLAGSINETMSRVLIKYLMPEDIAMRELGIFGACYKVSIIMAIFIQAFRFASEPFFFAQSKEKDAKQLYADVMKYFIIICLFIFLTVVLYIDIVKYFVGSDFYEGMKVVPVLLLANMLLGIFFNLSIWYKLTGETKFGAYLSVAGAIITLGLNIWWIPIFGYMGSAWVTLICYGIMTIASFIWGQKKFPVPYPVFRMLFYIVLAVAIYIASIEIPFVEKNLTFVINTLLMLVFVTVIMVIEKISLRRIGGMFKGSNGANEDIH